MINYSLAYTYNQVLIFKKSRLLKSLTTIQSSSSKYNLRVIGEFFAHISYNFHSL
jgi:hypothetical protein